MTTNGRTGITGYVLAGGKSSRMGTDKGLLHLHGMPLVQRVITQLLPAVDKTVIVTENPAYEVFGVEMISDTVKDIGPAGGIHAALTHAESERIFVVSCDMPFITTQAINYIVNYASQAPITVPTYHGRLQPLFGKYYKDCYRRWQQLLEEGMHALHDLVTHFDTLEVNVDENELFGETFFMNVNSKDDLRHALQHVHYGN